MNNLPFSPWVYEIGNSLISSLAMCVLVILVRFFATEVQQKGAHATYAQRTVKFTVGVCGLIVGEVGYRMWTWWGSYCLNADLECSWMIRRAWPFVPSFSIALEVAGLLCMIRMLVPGVWGRWAWVMSAAVSVSWSLFWFSGWDDVVTYLRGAFPW